MFSCEEKDIVGRKYKNKVLKNSLIQEKLKDEEVKELSLKCNVRINLSHTLKVTRKIIQKKSVVAMIHNRAANRFIRPG